ncbi:thiol reductant ABC exporter subunit CydD [uncultured Brevundimonas sp.]|uniref:thiol reductant ABC exporter subunit CydD n=1 Tax=uncultured Brevundimonas sp. TaxID=213418 RepID=UPI0030EE32B8|tara:strand:- start:39139 stop:40767 length:1629 start_codon:yes stop_codon:yes gene_type:complete
MSTVDVNPTVEPKRWLADIARPWRRLNGLAAGLVIADILPATGFALGLAMAIGALQQSPTAALPGLALAGVSLALRGLVAQAAVLTAGQGAAMVKRRVRGDLLTQLFAGRRPSGDSMTAVVDGVEALDGYYARFAPARLAAAVSPVLIIALCAVASPVAAGILTLTLIPFAFGMILTGTAAAAESRRQFLALERLSGLFLDRVRALPTLLSFQAEARTSREIARAADELETRTGRVLKIAFLSSGVLEFFSALSVALLAVYCGFNLLHLLPFPVPESLTLPRAFFVLAMAPEVYAPMRRLAAAYHERQAAEAAAASLVEAMPPAPAPARARRVPVTATAPAPALRFRGVTITYDDGVSPVHDFDLDVPAGAIVALVGPSGSGKSSLLHLLLGLAPLAGGEVEADGVALSQAGSFTDRVGWASQAPVVVPGTLGDNIALAARGASRESLQAVATLAGLDGDLDRVLDERGGGLSGGERRRLGLARALLKPAPILLLDEPTANLDAASKIALLPVIRAAARGRTTLIATHSAAVEAMADVVVRL